MTLFGVIEKMVLTVALSAFAARAVKEEVV